jgi:hypothetical protein
MKNTAYQAMNAINNLPRCYICAHNVAEIANQETCGVLSGFGRVAASIINDVLYITDKKKKDADPLQVDANSIDGYEETTDSVELIMSDGRNIFLLAYPVNKKELREMECRNMFA